jgi:FdhE protein
VAGATIRILPAEEIAARAADTAPRIVLPQSTTVFAERAMRLRQLAHGHQTMGDFLSFTAELVLAQQEALSALSSMSVQLVDLSKTPFGATTCTRDPIWRECLTTIVRIELCTAAG